MVRSQLRHYVRGQLSFLQVAIAYRLRLCFELFSIIIANGFVLKNPYSVSFNGKWIYLHEPFVSLITMFTMFGSDRLQIIRQ